MRTSDKTEQVCASLFAVHRDLANPKKDSKADAGKFSYQYLSLPALTAYLRPILTEYQLFTTQEITGGPGFTQVHTTVWHLSGQFIEFGPTFMPAEGDTQQVGSADTYCRRYALAAVFNIAADEDDDGKKASAVASPGASPAGKRGASPPNKAPRPKGTGASPDKDSTSVGKVMEELLGGDALATDQQWANLLAAVDGKTKDAVKQIDEKNGTNYFSYRNAREGATSDELEKALP